MRVAAARPYHTLSTAMIASRASSQSSAASTRPIFSSPGFGELPKNALAATYSGSVVAKSAATAVSDSYVFVRWKASRVIVIVGCEAPPVTTNSVRLSSASTFAAVHVIRLSYPDASRSDATAVAIAALLASSVARSPIVVSLSVVKLTGVIATPFTFPLMTFDVTSCASVSR